MINFKGITGLEFEYSASEIGAIYEALRSLCTKKVGHHYLYLTNKYETVAMLPLCNQSAHGMPVEGLFIFGFYHELLAYADMLGNLWRALSIDAKTNLEQLFKLQFPGISGRVVEPLINMVRNANYHEKKFHALVQIYRQFTNNVDPLSEIIRSLSAQKGRLQIYYPFIDEASLFHLLELNFALAGTDLNIDVRVHNCFAHIFPKEIHTRISQAIESTVKRVYPSINKIRYQSHASLYFESDRISVIPQDMRTVVFTHYMRYLFLGDTSTYVFPSFTKKDKGYDQRLLDIELLEKNPSKDFRNIWQLEQKALYVKYYLAIQNNDYRTIDILSRLAELSVSLGKFNHARSVYHLIKDYVNSQISMQPTNTEAREVLFADAMKAIDEKILELGRQVPQLDLQDYPDTNDLNNTEIVVNDGDIDHCFQYLDLKTKIRSCLIGKKDDFADLMVALKNFYRVTQDEKLRESLNQIINKLKRPEQFFLLESQMPHTAKSTATLAGVITVPVPNKKSSASEVKTLSDFLRFLQSVRRTLSSDDVGVSKEQADLKKILDQLYEYFDNFNESYEKADVSERAALLNTDIPVYFDGIADFISSADSRLFSVDSTGNLVKKGGAGQSAIFYFSGFYSKGVSNTAPAGPGFQIAHDLLFRKLFRVDTVITDTMLVCHPNGIPYLLQLSKAIEGPLLQNWLENNHPNELDFESFANAALMCMISQPGDAKPDNFIVVTEQGKNKLVYFDADIFGRGSVEKIKDGVHFCNLKSVLFCMPQMKQSLTPELRERLLSISPEVLLLEWLEELSANNDRAEKMFSYFFGENVQAQQLLEKSKVKFTANFLRYMYYAFSKIQALVASSPDVTLEKIFEQTDPVIYEFYQIVNQKFATGNHASDIMERMKYIYGTHKEFPRVSIEETLGGVKNKFTKDGNDIFNEYLGEVYKINMDSSLSPLKLMEVLIGTINYSYLRIEERTPVFEVVKKYISHIEHLRLINPEFLSLADFRDLITCGKNLKKISLIGRHNIKNDSMLKSFFSMTGSLEIEITPQNDTDIIIIRSLAARSFGQITAYTFSSYLKFPSYYDVNWGLFPIHYLIENVGSPMLLLFFFGDKSVDLKVHHFKTGNAVIHELIYFLYEGQRAIADSKVDAQLNKRLSLLPSNFKGFQGSKSPAPINTRPRDDTRIAILASRHVMESSDPEGKLGIFDLLKYERYVYAWMIMFHKYNISFDILNQNGLSPIHIAAQLGLSTLLSFFLEEKINLNLELQTQGTYENIFHIAIKCKQLEFLKTALERLDKEMINKLTSEQMNHDGECAVHLAVQNYQTFCLFLKYVAKGVNLNKLSASSLIPLHYALKSDQLDETMKTSVVKQLLALNFDGTGLRMSEPPAVTAQKSATANVLVDLLNNHYENNNAPPSSNSLTAVSLNTIDFMAELGKKRYDQLFVRAEELRLESDQIDSKDMLKRVDLALQSISLFVSSSNLAATILPYQNKVPVCQAKIDSIIRKLVSVLYAEPQTAVTYADFFNKVKEVRDDTLSVWQTSYNVLGANGAVIAGELVRKFKVLLVKSIDNAMIYLGKPPVPYAAFIMGGMVTHRIDLFSEIPFGFMYEDKPNSRAYEYFHALKILILIDFLRLGEVSYVFNDLIFDSNQLPLYSGFSNQKKGVRIGLHDLEGIIIGTSKDLAQRFSSPQFWRHFASFSTVTLLQSDEKLFGTPAIVEYFNKKFAEGTVSQTTNTVLDYIHGISEAFRREMFTVPDVIGLIDLDHIFFKYPYLLVEQLCIYYKINLRSNLENLQQLLNAGGLSENLARTLNELFSRYVSFVTRVKNSYGEDRAVVRVSNLKNHQRLYSPDNLSKIFHCEDDDLTFLMNYLSVSYTLFRATEKFLSGKQKIFYVLNPSASKLEKVGRYFAKMVLQQASKDANISIPKTDIEEEAEIKFLLILEAFRSKNYKDIASALEKLESTPQLFKEFKRDFMLLKASSLMNERNYLQAVKVLRELVSIINSDVIHADSYSKMYSEDKTHPKRNLSLRKSRIMPQGGNKDQDESKVSPISLAYPMYLLSNAYLHLDLHQLALTTIVATMKIDKKRAILIKYHAVDILLAIIILSKLGSAPAEMQTYFNTLSGLFSQLEVENPELYSSAVRCYVNFVTDYFPDDNEKVDLALTSLLKARYYDLKYFGDATLSALDNLVAFYKGALIKQGRQEAIKVFATIKVLAEKLGSYSLLARLSLLKDSRANMTLFNGSVTYPRTSEQRHDSLTFIDLNQSIIPAMERVELIVSLGLQAYSQTNDLTLLRRSRVELDLMHRTLNYRLIALNRLLDELNINKADIIKTIYKIKTDMIAILSMCVDVKMKLPYDSLLKTQFLQLFDLLRERNEYEKIITHVNEYIDIHSHLDSPENYFVILHAAQLYFESLEKVQPETLQHVHSEIVLAQMKEKKFIAVTSTLGLTAADKNQTTTPIKEESVYNKMIATLNKVFSGFLTTYAGILEKNDSSEYQNLFRVAHAYLNSPQRSLVLIIMRFLSLEIFNQMLSHDPLLAKDYSNSLDMPCLSGYFFYKAVSTVSYQFLLTGTSFAKIFDSVLYVEAKSNVIRFLFKEITSEELVERVAQWLKQSADAILVSYKTNGCVLEFNFSSDQTMRECLHKLSNVTAKEKTNKISPAISNEELSEPNSLLDVVTSPRSNSTLAQSGFFKASPSGLTQGQISPTSSNEASSKNNNVNLIATSRSGLVESRIDKSSSVNSEIPNLPSLTQKTEARPLPQLGNRLMTSLNGSQGDLPVLRSRRNI